MASWPYFGLASPPAWLKSSMSDASGSVAIRPSPWSAASCADSVPEAATPMGTGVSGRSYSLARSTSKCRPLKFTYSPVNRCRMIRMASLSRSWRTRGLGQPPPTTCSLRFSPAPSPRVNRPPDSTPMVAAFWATTAG